MFFGCKTKNVNKQSVQQSENPHRMAICIIKNKHLLDISSQFRRFAFIFTFQSSKFNFLSEVKTFETLYTV